MKSKFVRFLDAPSEHFQGSLDFLTESVLLSGGKIRVYVQFPAVKFLISPPGHDAKPTDKDAKEWESKVKFGWIPVNPRDTTKIMTLGRSPVAAFHASNSGDSESWAWLWSPKNNDVSTMEIKLSDLWLKREELDLHFPNGEGSPQPQVATTQPKTRLRADAEENYLRVIAYLWAMSELDSRPHTAAKAMVDEIKLWDWDKPERDTIAKALTQAAFLAKGKHPKFGK